MVEARSRGPTIQSWSLRAWLWSKGTVVHLRSLPVSRSPGSLWNRVFPPRVSFAVSSSSQIRSSGLVLDLPGVGWGA